MAPIPITIVTGFLGSGKTTLILGLARQLRARNPGYRLALLKNEFGDVAVDSELAGSSAVAGVRELLGGCICCNLVGGLGAALEELAAGAAPDRVVVETSGSAFPATLALEVNRLARETGGRYALDGVVSVVDVENWAGYDDTSYTARIQARYTDLVVLNKWEAAGEDRYEECLDRLGDLEVDVARVRSDRGRVDADLVFGIDGALARQLTADDDDDDDHRQPNGHDHHHQQEVEVLSVELAGPDAAAVSTDPLLRLLRAAPKDEVYRIKAVVALAVPPQNSDVDLPLAADDPPRPGRRYILNWAFGRWTFTPLPPDDSGTAAAAAPLRMTLILARDEANKWKKKVEAGAFLELDGPQKGELSIKRLL